MYVLAETTQLNTFVSDQQNPPVIFEACLDFIYIFNSPAVVVVRVHLSSDSFPVQLG